MVSPDVVIVGAGPAGTATALHLLKIDPAFAGNILILDKAVHPREKICAGGLIPQTLQSLHELDVPLTVPQVRVERASVRVPPARQICRDDGNLCTVVRRDEFDHLLVQTARARGAEIREGEKVLAVVREPNGVRIITEQETYRARIVVGADGSGSRVRRQLVGDDSPASVGRALMCDIPVAETHWDGFAQQRYDFSFLPVPQGLKGYLWEFPCVIGGVPHVNIGIYTAAGSPLSNADLHRLLTDEISALGPLLEDESPKSKVQSPKSEDENRKAKDKDIPHPSILDPRSSILNPLRFRAFPIYGYSPTRPLAAPHVVLVGDAAGAEPLMGEGISFALEYGKFAATAIETALCSRQCDFTAYTDALSRSQLGKKLTRLYWTTRLCYGRAWRVCFAVAARSPRLQSVGLQWYNGVEGWHQRSGWEAMRAVLWPRAVA